MQDDQQVINNAKIFVGNLPWSATSDQLQEIFSQFGAIKEATLISDRMTGRSKGFGFVEFVNEADAAKAVEAMNGSDLDGRAIIVNIARPKADRPRGDFGGDRRGGFNRGPRNFDRSDRRDSRSY